MSRRSLIIGGGLGVGLAALGWSPAQAAPGVPPFAVPGVKRWQPSPGILRLGRRVDVVVPAGAGDRLEAVADRLARDLRARGRASRVRIGGARPGDVVLVRRGRPEPGHDRGPRSGEAYEVVIDTLVQIRSTTSTGLYWGTRTLLQWLDQTIGKLPYGTGQDWPSFPERALMIDAGRKYFPLSWLKDRVREMSDMKMNLLHLHLSDDQGWRLESSASPQIHSEHHLTRAQMRDLVEYAAERYVTVMPEFDVPGHLTAGLRNYPELQLTDPAGQKNEGKLDYTLPTAKEWVLDRYREYLPLFPGVHWHLGGDEFLDPATSSTYPQLAAYAQARGGTGASAQDGALAFLNDLSSFMQAKGKRCRIWDDGVAGTRNVTLRHTVGVDWWTDVSLLGDPTAVVTPQNLIDAGYRVNNCSYYPLYYAYRTARQPAPGLQAFYEGWNPGLFRGDLYATDSVAMPYYEVDMADATGGKFHMWLDEPSTATTAQVATDLAPRLAITAERTWNLTSNITSYSAWDSMR